MNVNLTSRSGLGLGAWGLGLRSRGAASGIAPSLRVRVLVHAACVFVLAGFAAGCSKPQAHLYTTWSSMEFDKIASAWIIKRYADKDAQFKFFPKETVIEEGTPFDVPGAEMLREHGLACSETVIRKFGVTAPAAATLARMSHEIDVNPWARHAPETEALNRRIVAVIRANRDDPHACFKAGFEVLDDHFRAISHNDEPAR